jgi:hypothetical protein
MMGYLDEKENDKIFIKEHMSILKK